MTDTTEATDGNTQGAAWQGRLWLAPRRGIVLYVGPGGPAGAHAHHAIQLAVSFDAPMQVTVGTETHSVRSSIIGRDQRHALHADGTVAMLWADPQGPTGRLLDQRARRHDGRDLSSAIPEAGPPSRPREVADFVLRLLHAAGARTPVGSITSAHVERALEYLEGAIQGRPSLTEAAAHAAISPSRLTHLFTPEVGIPFRRYVLWLRLVRAVEAIAARSDLTTAAAAAGFSDSAHLSRTFKANFGLPPSSLLLMDVVPGMDG
jgi:AraC-like DNA-binding protein